MKQRDETKGKKEERKEGDKKGGKKEEREEINEYMGWER